MNPKAQPVDHASATIKKATNSDPKKIEVGRAVVTGVLASPTIGSAPDVATNANKWTANIDALETNAKLTITLRSQVKTTAAKQRTLRRQWAASKKQLLTSVDLFAAGSADVMQAFGVDVITHETGADPATIAPGNLVAGPGKKHGQVFSEWVSAIRGRHFVVQWATDPASPATWSPNIAYTKKKFILSGQLSATSVHFRVAYQASALPDGHGLWSPWIAGTVT